MGLGDLKYCLEKQKKTGKKKRSLEIERPFVNAYFPDFTGELFLK